MGMFQRFLILNITGSAINKTMTTTLKKTVKTKKIDTVYALSTNSIYENRILLGKCALSLCIANLKIDSCMASK